MLNCNILYLKENNILTNKPLNILSTKPWQASLKKSTQPRKGERKNKERGPKYEPEAQQPKVSHKMRQRNNLCSKAPHQSQEAHQGMKGKPEERSNYVASPVN
jgi:hypothetical protein